MRVRNYGRKIVWLFGCMVFLMLFAGIYMNSEAKEIGTAERESSVTFRETYEKKEEEKKKEEKERKEQEKKETAASRKKEVTEGEAASIPKSLPQTGEESGDAGMGILTGGMLLAGYLLKKEKA